VKADRARFHFEKQVMQPSDGCRLWVFGTLGKGYGRLEVNGRSEYVHVLTCTAWHGPRPEGMEVAHSCGNRRCWAGEHLRWATPKENNADKVLHGTNRAGEQNALAKLTNAQATEVRRRYAAGGVSQSTLAAEYGVDRSAISLVINRKTYREAA
jgi:hypothetical protein